MNTQGTRQIHAFDGSQPVAVFVDPFLFDPLEKHSLMPAKGSSIVLKRLLRGTWEQLPEAQMPYILWMPVNSGTRGLLHDLQDIARTEANWIPGEGESQTQPRTVAGFVTGALVGQGPEKLRIVLGKMRLVIDSTDRQRIFRFWDPRVMQHFAMHGVHRSRIDFGTLLHSPEEAMSWFYFDSLGRPGRHDIECHPGTSGAPFSRSLQLDGQMEKELKRLGTLNKALFHAIAQDAGRLRALDIAEVFEKVLIPNLLPFETMSGLDEDDKAALTFIRYATGRAFEHDEKVMREVFFRKEQGAGAVSFMQDLGYFLA